MGGLMTQQGAAGKGIFFNNLFYCTVASHSLIRDA